MRESIRKRALLGFQAFLARAFAAAGLAKLVGAQLLAVEFGMMGLGQWFR